MRNFIDAVSREPLNEASFKYFISRPSCVTFSTTRSSLPNLIIFGDKPLVEANEVTTVIVSTTKLMTQYRDTYRLGGIDSKYERFRLLFFTLSRPDEILKNRGIFEEFPQFFKIIKLSGREKIFHYFTTDLKAPEEIYDKIFGARPEAGISEEHAERLHNATLIFPEAMRKSRRDNFLPVLEKAYNYLKAAGLEKVFSGNIRVIQTNAKTVGTYNLRTRDMTVSPQRSDLNDAVYTLIHEYAHKHYYEFLTQEQRNIVVEKFSELVKKGFRLASQIKFRKQSLEKIDTIKSAVDTSLLKVGTKITYIGKNTKKSSLRTGDELTIVQYNKLTDEIRLRFETNSLSFKVKNASLMLREPDVWQIEGNTFVKDDAPPVASEGKFYLTSDKWFPTEYSTKEPEEWYAECFAFFVLDHLHGEPEKWFSQIIR